MNEAAGCDEHFRRVDGHACALYLEVPPSQVVLLQSYFELYEGMGVVRTIETGRSLICILTTQSQSSQCLAALESLKGQIDWRFADSVPDVSLV